MPKVKIDPYADREKAVRAWIAGGMAVKGIDQTELAKKSGVPRTTIGYRIRNPDTLRDGERWQIQKVIGTPKDVAEMILKGAE